MASKTRKKTKKETSHKTQLFSLKVEIIEGYVTEEFAEENPDMSRTIQIRGDQTLEHLHGAIFDAFDRFDEHLYEFQFGEAPRHRRNKRYVLPMPGDFGPGSVFFEEEPAEDLTRTKIGSLGLRKRRRFWYWFDFGDDWWHRIEVVDVQNEVPKGKYPKVIERLGASPPQYPGMGVRDEDGDWEDEEEYEDDE